MDSRILLDYALFHLTPTRTRCDLVVFSGGKSEKLASGLVEPFVAHMKYAKDQILKGGYSITLRPPTPDAFWFTKDTFQRFVRFVSTPEILERFLRTEQEISQIEKSIEENEISSSRSAVNGIEGSTLAVDGASNTTNSSSKPKNETEVAPGGASEENSKSRLQRVLDTRKALLLKEQAMAFARAKAAGFKIENMDDLTYFSDAFGATRLREACVGFRDLYMLKCNDARWMDEVAAMEAFPPNMFSYVGASGITLASDNEHNGSPDILDGDRATITDKGQPAATAAEFQMKMPWPNQVPHYMYNFQNPMQQVPPYPGYPFSGAHPVSPYYPEHGQWPVDGRMNGFARQSHKSKKKGKSKNYSGSEDDEQSSGSSGSGTDTDESGKHDKKHSQHERSLVKKKKKSSKTVVIRNINYITSKKRSGDTDDTSDGSSSEGTAEFDEDAIKQEVVDAVTSLKRHQHSGSHKKKSGRNRRSSIHNGTDSSANMPEEGQTNENWNAFQNILMSQEESHPAEVLEKNPLDVEDPLAAGISHDGNTIERAPVVGFETDKVKMQHSTSDDSVIGTQRDGYNDGRTDVINITNVEERHLSMRTKTSEDVQYVFSQKSEDSASSPWRMTSDPSADSSLIRNGNREDWFIVNQAKNLDIQEAKQIILDESNTFPSAKDSNLTEANKRASIDDSFMVQSHQSLDGQYDTEWRTDIIMESGLTTVPPPETSSQKPSKPFQEPDDLCVILARDSVIESSGSWTPEMDYGIETSITEVDKTISVETKTEQTPIADKKSTNSKKPSKTSGKEARSRLLQGTISRGLMNGSNNVKKPSSTSRLANPKGKVDKEEETRKRTEELVLERQKRIAERSAAAASKKVLGRSKTTSSMMQETRRLSTKPVSAK